MSIDLHIHSTVSDGTMSPAELVRFAKKKGLKAIAITDHDTFEGVAEAVEAGRECNLDVISGVELSVNFDGTSVHLLGYLFDYQDNNLLNAVKKLQNGRAERNTKIIDKLNDYGLETSDAELKKYGGIGLIGRPHIARLLIDKGWATSMDDAFDHYLGKNGKAYSTRLSYSLEQATKIIHSAGGVCVVAHPANLIQSSMGVLKTDLLQSMITKGIDGFEVYYPTHARKFRRNLIAFVKSHGLIMTGGSDFHGDIRPGTTLAGGKNVSVPYELLTVMKEYRDIKS